MACIHLQYILNIVTSIRILEVVTSKISKIGSSNICTLIVTKVGNFKIQGVNIDNTKVWTL